MGHRPRRRCRRHPRRRQTPQVCGGPVLAAAPAALRDQDCRHSYVHSAPLGVDRLMHAARLCVQLPPRRPPPRRHRSLHHPPPHLHRHRHLPFHPAQAQAPPCLLLAPRCRRLQVPRRRRHRPQCQTSLQVGVQGRAGQSRARVLECARRPAQHRSSAARGAACPCDRMNASPKNGATVTAGCMQDGPCCGMMSSMVLR